MEGAIHCLFQCIYIGQPLSVPLSRFLGKLMVSLQKVNINVAKSTV